MRFPDPPQILDADTAEELLAFFDKFPVLKTAGFSLWTFESMTPEAANAIARSGLDILFLDSVRVVSLEVIRILAESQVSCQYERTPRCRSVPELGWPVESGTAPSARLGATTRRFGN